MCEALLYNSLNESFANTKVPASGHRELTCASLPDSSLPSSQCHSDSAAAGRRPPARRAANARSRGGPVLFAPFGLGRLLPPFLYMFRNFVFSFLSLGFLDLLFSFLFINIRVSGVFLAVGVVAPLFRVCVGALRAAGSF